MEKKKKQLEEVADQIKVCKECKIDRVGVAVVGEGNSDADVVFIGEAPGRLEAEVGRPFIGRSGKFLRGLIRDTLQLKEEEVYITSPVKYLPIYVTPKPSDIIHGRTHLEKQLDIIDPKYIVLLGNTAITAVTGKKMPALTKHGTTMQENNRTYFLTIHPAAAIRFQKFRKVIEEDFATLKVLLG